MSTLYKHLIVATKMLLILDMIVTQQLVYHQSASNCGRAYLTTSTTTENYLQLNWYVPYAECPNGSIPEYVALFKNNPMESHASLLNSTTLAVVNITGVPFGKYTTSVKFGHPWLLGNWEYNEELESVEYGSHCFPYWAALFKDNQIVYTQCLAIHPTWMHDNREHIGNTFVSRLLFPGTHNSGAFLNTSSLWSRYVINQDRDVWTQLVHGIRYLDFRVGYYRQQGFSINHDIIRVRDVIPVLKQIRKFAQLAPTEVIIIDFHRFPYPTNFTDGLHRAFVKLMLQYLGDFAIPRLAILPSRQLKLNTIWANNASLILCHSHNRMVQENPLLWPPLMQFWGQTNNVSKLKSYIAKTIKQHLLTQNPFFALMAALTPQVSDIVLGINTPRKLANKLSLNLTQWFHYEFTKDVSIVATDFFLNNDIVNIAIEHNQRLII